ncbi:MAG: hypothetical protein JJE52_11220 [Acidimicrobiia bacterium]|nr:hypothetical protein [Acidimicrobiia bacterium]
MDESALMDIAGNTDRPDWQASRLAELVLHLTGCSADEALVAVGAAAEPPVLTNEDALERVARAIVRLRH